MTTNGDKKHWKFAFYCSGHGYGHATRVSALSSALLVAGHEVYIVTNAPTQPFSAVLPPSEIPSPELRLAAPAPKTDPLPSYAHYRRRNVDAGILQPKAYDVDRMGTIKLLQDFMQEREKTLPEEVEWLKQMSIDCVLSDSTFLGCAAGHAAGIPSVIVSNFTFDSCYSYLSFPALPSMNGEEVEPPIPSSILDPLVEQAIADYACASLLLRLPGVIPIPGFDTDVPMPSGRWVNAARTSFTPEIDALLSRNVDDIPASRPKGQPRGRVIDVPLIVRPPHANVHTKEFRHNLLRSMHVPHHLLDAKIVLVSFGGQSIPRPRSRPPSPLSTPLLRTSSTNSNASLDVPISRQAGLLPEGWIAIVCGLAGNNNEIRNDLPANFYASEKDVYVPDLTATADVVLGKLVSRTTPRQNHATRIPWGERELTSSLSEQGYGTCSETISNHTPFIYVPRPLFVEEFGLKRLMTARGVALELDRTDFEAGRWEFHILEAHARGAEAKEKARNEGFKDEKAGQFIREELEKFLDGWEWKR